jgi:hypothetical protein
MSTKDVNEKLAPLCDDNRVAVATRACGIRELANADEALEMQRRRQYLDAPVARLGYEHMVVCQDANIAWSLKLQRADAVFTKRAQEHAVANSEHIYRVMKSERPREGPSEQHQELGAVPRDRSAKGAVPAVCLNDAADDAAQAAQESHDAAAEDAAERPPHV